MRLQMVRRLRNVGIGLFVCFIVAGNVMFGAHGYRTVYAQNLTPPARGESRGYLTTPAELDLIRQKAESGLEPYKSAMEDVIDWADKDWDYRLDARETCGNADRPSWLDNERGVPRLYGKALAYHLAQDDQYAEQVRDILERIMTEVESFTLEQNQCLLTVSWGIPEVIAAADLIEGYWIDMTCTGPVSTVYGENDLIEGNCKTLFQNWLVKNPYYLISLIAEESQSNWGAAATNALAYIADYLWDRPDVTLIHRRPPEISEGRSINLTPAQAYVFANQLMLARMNGYRVELRSRYSCDDFSLDSQSDQWLPVKSQITETGIIPEEARREEYCNTPVYNGDYQNYPQLHIGHNIQQCELMLRRGDSSCYDNIDYTDFPNYEFVDREGVVRTTHLYPGRGSLERAINAVIVDSGTEWRHDSALEMAYRYYHIRARFGQMEAWPAEFDRPARCDQDACFGTLTHGFAPWETVDLPPAVAPPSSSDEQF